MRYCCRQSRVTKTKQATTAGAAVAKGVATGMQAATVEVGTTLIQTVTTTTTKTNTSSSSTASAAAAAGSNKPVVPEPLMMVGGIGMELLRVSFSNLQQVYMQAVTMLTSQCLKPFRNPSKAKKHQDPCQFAVHGPHGHTAVIHPLCITLSLCCLLGDIATAVGAVAAAPGHCCCA